MQRSIGSRSSRLSLPPTSHASRKDKEVPQSKTVALMKVSRVTVIFSVQTLTSLTIQTLLAKCSRLEARNSTLTGSTLLGIGTCISKEARYTRSPEVVTLHSSSVAIPIPIQDNRQRKTNYTGLLGRRLPSGGTERKTGLSPAIPDLLGMRDFTSGRP